MGRVQFGLSRVVVLLAAAGCGDGDPIQPRDAGTDSGFDAGFDAGPACPSQTLLVTTSDFVAGETASVDVSNGAVTVSPSPAQDQDTLPAKAGCTPALLQRALGQLQLQEPLDVLSTALTVDLNPPGSSSSIYAANPQTLIEVSATKLYVILQASNQVLIVDPTQPASGAVQGTIDLSSFLDPDDTDGLVDQTGAIRVGDRVFVGLGNFWFDSSFAIQFEGSLLAVIDTATDALIDVDPNASGVQAIDLMFENPWRGMVVDETRNRLLVGATGATFGVIDGGIEAIDLATLASTGGVLLETDLGAEISGLARVGQDSLAVRVGADLRAYALGDLVTPATAPSFDTWQAGVNGFVEYGEGLVTWTGGTLQVFSGSGLDITPGTNPIQVGTLPIYGVVAFP